MAPKSVIAASLVAAASSTSVPPYFQKRWDTSLCAANPGVAIPDSDTFQFPLENYRSDLCWDLCVGDQNACTTTSTICFTFSGSNLVFTYSAIPGYTYSETDIWLGLAPPSGDMDSQYTSTNGACAISSDSSTATCTIPYSSIITSGDVLSGMCPNGDAAGLTFYLYTGAVLNNEDGTGTVNAEGRLSCADYPTCSSYLPNTYWELYYRCTDCPAQSSSSPVPSSSAPASSSSTPISPVLPSTSAPSSSSVPSPPPSSSVPPTSCPPSSIPSSTPPSSTPVSPVIPSSSSTPPSSSPPPQSSPPPSSSSPAPSTSCSSSSSSPPPSSPSSSPTKPTSSPTKPSSAPASSSPCTTSPHPSSQPAHPTPSSTTTYCTFGTAFGYSTSCSNTFQSMDRCPNTCQRWGWYETFSSADIAKGLSGPLYVGAGGNDQSRAVNVGSWSAQTQKDGKIYVYYSVGGGYSLGQVMVDVGCTPIASCDPQGFDVSFTPTQGATSFTTPSGIAMPNCGRNGQAYVIVQATIESAHTTWGFPGQPGNYQCDRPVCN